MEEYPRLAGTLHEHAWPFFTSEDKVLVAERNGRIVRSVSLHHEWRLDIWTADSEKGNVSSGRAMLKSVRQLLRALWIPEVVMMALSDEGKRLIRKIGQFVHMDCEHYAVRVR